MDSLLPFLQGFFLPYNMSVYPGALRFAGNTGITNSLWEYLNLSQTVVLPFQPNARRNWAGAKSGIDLRAEACSFFRRL